MNRWLASSLLALGLLAGGLWLLWPRLQPEPAAMTGAHAPTAVATTDRTTAPAVPVDATSTPVAAVTPPQAPSDFPDAVPASAARDEARGRLIAAWSCLDKPEVDPGDPAEIWATLTPEHQRQAEQDYAQALAWAEQKCGNLPRDLLDKNGRLLPSELLALVSTGPGDPPSKLAAALRGRKGNQDPTTADGVRAALDALLRSALTAPAAEELQLIGAVVSTQGPYGAFGPGSGSARSLRPMVWALAACDLGADCGPRSHVLRQLCLQSLLCGYPNLESAVVDGVWPQGMSAALQEERRLLVQRLRHGGVGVFDPVQPPPGGG